MLPWNDPTYCFIGDDGGGGGDDPGDDDGGYDPPEEDPDYDPDPPSSPGPGPGDDNDDDDDSYQDNPAPPPDDGNDPEDRVHFQNQRIFRFWQRISIALHKKQPIPPYAFQVQVKQIREMLIRPKQGRCYAG